MCPSFEGVTSGYFRGEKVNMDMGGGWSGGIKKYERNLTYKRTHGNSSGCVLFIDGIGTIVKGDLLEEEGLLPKC